MFIVTTPIQRVSSVGAACFNARINPASVTFRSYGASEIPVNVQVYKHFVPNGTAIPDSYYVRLSGSSLAP